MNVLVNSFQTAENMSFGGCGTSAQFTYDALRFRTLPLIVGALLGWCIAGRSYERGYEIVGALVRVAVLTALFGWFIAVLAASQGNLPALFG